MALSGAVVGYLAEAPGKASLGAVAGISFSMWVFSIRPITLLQNELMLNLVLSFVTLTTAYLTYYKDVPDDKYPIIIASAFSGAYAIVCGIDLFLKVGFGQVFFAVIRGVFETLPHQR